MEMTSVPDASQSYDAHAGGVSEKTTAASMSVALVRNTEAMRPTEAPKPSSLVWVTSGSKLPDALLRLNEALGAFTTPETRAVAVLSSSMTEVYDTEFISSASNAGCKEHPALALRLFEDSGSNYTTLRVAASKALYPIAGSLSYHHGLIIIATGPEKINSLVISRRPGARVRRPILPGLSLRPNLERNALWNITLPGITLSSLENLTMDCAVGGEEFVDFLKRHPTITRLTITNDARQCWDALKLPNCSLKDCSPNLRVLMIKFDVLIDEELKTIIEGHSTLNKIGFWGPKMTEWGKMQEIQSKVDEIGLAVACISCPKN
ncbi:hypothetical protein B0H11DRAFT_2086174 [Mycena galericulata]|nr:hypothetical protein B0H11DRAFT_2086174 [Mycena galericulata]